MIRIIIESPYQGDRKTHEEYARRAMKDALEWGEAPLLGHLLYTQVLDDNDPEQRKLGMDAAREWVPAARHVVVYADYGISPGMQEGIDWAKANGKLVIYRQIGKNPGAHRKD